MVYAICICHCFGRWNKRRHECSALDIDMKEQHKIQKYSWLRIKDQVILREDQFKYLWSIVQKTRWLLEILFIEIKVVKQRSIFSILYNGKIPLNPKEKFYLTVIWSILYSPGYWAIKHCITKIWLKLKWGYYSGCAAT